MGVPGREWGAEFCSPVGAGSSAGACVLHARPRCIQLPALHLICCGVGVGRGSVASTSWSPQLLPPHPHAQSPTPMCPAGALGLGLVPHPGGPRNTPLDTTLPQGGGGDRGARDRRASKVEGVSGVRGCPCPPQMGAQAMAISQFPDGWPCPLPVQNPYSKTDYGPEPGGGEADGRCTHAQNPPPHPPSCWV